MLFFHFTSMDEVHIAASVTSIGRYAFSMSNISSLLIPAGVTSIGDGAFADCRYLVNVTCMAAEPPYLGDGNQYDAWRLKEDNTLYVPAGCRQAYVGNAMWSAAFKHIVEMQHTI